MARFGPEKYERGVWLGLTISKAALEADCAERGKSIGYENMARIQKILQNHYNESKLKGALGYSQEQAFVSAMIYDTIPKIFGISKDNCKKYDLEDYLAGVELILEQFQTVEQADRKRLSFLRNFLTDLGINRISRLDEPRMRFAA